jgi:hypothetical protein
MKLWILRPVEESKLWKPWYDKCFGFVVEAATETDAREIAHQNAGDENRGEFMKRTLGPKDSAWLSSEHSTCVPLEPKGVAHLVMKDFHAA